MGKIVETMCTSSLQIHQKTKIMTYPILVLNEPHASIEGLYDNELSFWNIDARFINEVVFRLTDWHTDFLFHGFRDARVRPVRFPYSRFVVDAERLWDDPLEQEGQGILYRRFGGYCRTIPQQCESRLYDLWRGHQHNLKRALCENALLLDCHSFPEEQGDVDICIGFNDDWSKPDRSTLELAVNLFEENGYSVGINYPYSNSEAPECPFRYQSMMLEVNKRVYLERGTLYLKTRHPQKRSVSDLMAQLMGRLVGA